MNADEERELTMAEVRAHLRDVFAAALDDASASVEENLEERVEKHAAAFSEHLDRMMVDARERMEVTLRAYGFSAEEGFLMAYATFENLAQWRKDVLRHMRGALYAEMAKDRG